MTDVNHLQEANRLIRRHRATQEYLEVKRVTEAQAHALIAIAEQLDLQNRLYLSNVRNDVILPEGWIKKENNDIPTSTY